MLCRLYKNEIIFNIDEIESVFNGLNIWQSISPTLFSIFWSLEISDIFVPSIEYEKEIKSHTQSLRDEDYNKS